MRRLINAFFYSASGLSYAFRTQEAFRQEIVVLLVGTVIAFMADVSNLHRLLLIGSIVMLIIVELLNTAIEVTIDRISSDRHELSKYAKDLGSAAVLLTSLLTAATWATIFFG